MSGITPDMIEQAAARVYRKMADETEDQLKGPARRAAAAEHLRRAVLLAPGVYAISAAVLVMVVLGALTLGIYTGLQNL